MATRTARRTVAKPGRPTAITAVGGQHRWKKWLVMGDSGVGKTVFGGTAPNNIFLEFDPEGTESAEVHESTSQVWQIPNWKEWQEALDYFERGSGCEDFEWVTIDTISEGEDVCWSDHLATMARAKPGSRSLYKPALDDYPIVWNKVKAFIERFNRLPINVLYTAHVLELSQWDEENEEYSLRMPLIGSTKNGILSRKICAKVSMVGYLEVVTDDEEDEEGTAERVEYRRLSVTPRLDRIAKNRYGWTKAFREPTMPKLIAAADQAMKKGSTEPSRRVRRVK